MRITEITKTPAQKELAQTLGSLIKKQCSQFLPVYNAVGPLYRGATKGKDIILNLRSPENRVPVSLEPEQQKFIDENLIEVFGPQCALRSKSIFCTGDLDVALEYGAVYQIFPKNGFQYMWCDFKDLVADAPSEFYRNLDSEEIRGVDFVKKYNFHSNEFLSEAIAKEKEIAIRGECIAIDTELAFSLFPNCKIR